MTQSHDPEPHGSRDTFVPPTEKLDKFGFPVRTFEEQLADLKSRIAGIEADPLDLVQEMKVALDSLTEEDMKPHDRPVPPVPSPEEKTIHYHNKSWWFWDETGQYRHGPYETHAECVKDFNHYCNVYLGEPEDPS